MKFKFLKNHYKLIASSLVTVSISSLGLLNHFLQEASNPLVEEMMKAFEEEERLDEIAFKRANYPSILTKNREDI
ncbi:hypothetical protein MHF_0359 [Mycoplasma haemofelis Ohio2]|uniref:Uncharacterized protein n=1 Tax=Mycoplasma haemofelis (strain Ohio2) TaxID=859194 RepID=F6FH33_MYCHI|nr:hypothetical protein MHF_0359 [Mycoplasma haemofelis Ohio2]